MPLDLQYVNGKLSVIVVRDSLTNEIYGILDNEDNAREHKFKLSKMGFSANHMKIERYWVKGN